MARFVSTVVFVLVVAACGGGAIEDQQTPTTGGPDGSTESTLPEPEPRQPVESSFRMCSDLEWVRAPDEVYGDSPIYVGNEMPVETVVAWADQFSGYEGIWVDRERNGWITIAFSEDADLRQDEVRQEFPGDGVVAVHVDWTKEELADLQGRVVEVLQPLGWSFSAGQGITTGFVSVDIGVLTPERLRVMELNFTGERICLSGLHPDDAIAEGPQPTEGEGWRLLAAEKGAGQPYRTGIAWDENSYEALWAEARIATDSPVVDFDTSVVVWFGAVYGSGCENLRLDDVEVTGSLVHGRIVLPTSSGTACNADANPFAFIVSVERDRLPAAPFFVQLSERDPPAGAPEERTIVDADLRVPGSSVPEGSISQGTYDPEASIDLIQPGAVIEPGFLTQMSMYTHCGIDWIGLNGITWHAADQPTIPDEWQEQLDGESIVVEVLITEGDPPHLTATANGVSVEYEASGQDLPGCD